MFTKWCTQCGTEKPFDAFYRDRRLKIGLAGRCKICDKKYRPKGWDKKYRPIRKRIKNPFPFCNIKRRHRKKRVNETIYRRRYLAERRKNDPLYRLWKAKKDKQYRQTLKGKLRIHKARSKRRANGGRITLTAEQWQKTLIAFSNRCAYCSSQKNLTIDHFIPLVYGGHTILGNIVPACSHCNSSKQHKMPDKWCNPNQLISVMGILETL